MIQYERASELPLKKRRETGIGIDLELNFLFSREVIIQTEEEKKDSQNGVKLQIVPVSRDILNEKTPLKACF